LEDVERKLFLMGKPTDSMVALNNRDYLFAGELMVMSMLQGGPAPAFLNPSEFAYLSKGSLAPEDNEGNYKAVAMKVNKGACNASLSYNVRPCLDFNQNL